MAFDIYLFRNFGKEAALSAGIDYARGDAVLLIDADFQHPMEKLTEMCHLWQSGYDMVYGVIVDRGNESFLKRFGTRFFYSFNEYRNRRSNSTKCW
jgi:glycosyltransferase involved in cell wall biosynthesis